MAILIDNRQERHNVSLERLKHLAKAILNALDCPEGELSIVIVDDPGIRELNPRDVAGAILYALDTPWHVNVNLIELQPTEQTYGGSQFVPADERD